MLGCIVSGRMVSRRWNEKVTSSISHLQYYGNWIQCCSQTEINIFLTLQAQTDFQQVGETQFLLNIPEADNINHIVIFLTDTVSLPPGTAGSVYFSWPDPVAPPVWQYLGYIANSKPSAIFKISQLKKLDEMEISNQFNVFGVQPISHIAQIGISIEPENMVSQLVPATVSSFVHFLTYIRITFDVSIKWIFISIATDNYKQLRSIRTKNGGEFHQFCI